MSEEEEHFQVEIQKTLASINDVTIKIKRELMMIIDLMKDGGHLRTAVKNANEALSSVVIDLGIDITPDAITNTERDKDKLDTLLISVTSDFVAKTLLSITEGTEAESQCLQG